MPRWKTCDLIQQKFWGLETGGENITAGWVQRMPSAKWGSENMSKKDHQESGTQQEMGELLVKIIPLTQWKAEAQSNHF